MAIWLIVQQSYGLGVEAVKEPFGPILAAPVPLSVRKQREQSTTWVTGFFDNFWTFLWHCLIYRSRMPGSLAQWCTRPFVLPSVATYGQMPSSCYIRWWCNRLGCSRWWICTMFWGSGDPCQIFSVSWGGKGVVVSIHNCHGVFGPW